MALVHTLSRAQIYGKVEIEPNGNAASAMLTPSNPAVVKSSSSEDVLKFVEIIVDDVFAIVSNMRNIMWSLNSDNNNCEKLFERMLNYESSFISSREINFHYNQ